MTALAKNVISRNFSKCDSQTDSKDIKNWCFREMSEALVDAINSRFNSTDIYTVTIGDNNRCFSESLGLNLVEGHLFDLDTIYFEITRYNSTC